MTGILYIVATPIGNLGDTSPRAIEVLKQVDLIAAEDTRHSKKLLQHFGINTSMLAYHEHNEREQADSLVEKLKAGQSIAVISDAGTPLINDPGYRIVARAHEYHIPVVPVPGPSALVAALSVSGLPTDRFAYEGYLPPRQEARLKKLQDLKHEQRTLVFYETPHRIRDTVNAMRTVFGDDRHIALARELTKQYEQVVLESLVNIARLLEEGAIPVKGEFVIVVAAAEAVSSEDAEVLRIYQLLSDKLSATDAAALTAKITGWKKNAVYQLAIKQQD